MFKKIGIVIVVLIAVLLLISALQSPNYEIARDVTIKAPADKIFPYLNNQKLAAEWGPWMEEDKDAKMSFVGPESGVGSATQWTGGTKLGTGSATITESVPNERVVIHLEYKEPFVMTQESYYLVESKGADTHVTWKVIGQNNFIGRVMCNLMTPFNGGMDKMVGTMFQKGLDKLKAITEKGG